MNIKKCLDGSNIKAFWASLMFQCTTDMNVAAWFVVICAVLVFFSFGTMFEGFTTFLETLL